VRISTGRDAADCAFLSYHGGYVGLERLRVDAWVVPDAASPDGLETFPSAPLEGVATDPALDDLATLIQIA
jgi:hypothetical protein